MTFWKKALAVFGVTWSEEAIQRHLGKTTVKIAEALMPRASKQHIEECALLRDKLFQGERILQSQVILGAKEALRKVKAMGLGCAVPHPTPDLLWRVRS